MSSYRTARSKKDLEELHCTHMEQLRISADSSPSVLDTEDLEHCRRVADEDDGLLGDGVLHLGANFRVDSSSCGFDSDATSLVEL